MCTTETIRTGTRRGRDSGIQVRFAAGNSLMNFETKTVLEKLFAEITSCFPGISSAKTTESCTLHNSHFRDKMTVSVGPGARLPRELPRSRFPRDPFQPEHKFSSFARDDTGLCPELVAGKEIYQLETERF